MRNSPPNLSRLCNTKHLYAIPVSGSGFVKGFLWAVRSYKMIYSPEKRRIPKNKRFGIISTVFFLEWTRISPLVKLQKT
jgi:hypothetical protein